jgi:extracellular elastinolytic metalloproteinase
VKYRRIVAASAALPLAVVLAATPGGAASSETAAAQPAAPSFYLTEPSSDPADEIALSYLADKAEDHGVVDADLEELLVLSEVPGSNGATHVNVVQLLGGLQVLGGHATVSVTSAGEVLYVSAGFVPGVGAARVASTPRVTPVEALESAAEELTIDGVDDATAGPSAQSVDQSTLIETEAAAEPVEARKVWQPTSKGLRLAWELVIDEAEADHLWHVTVDALTGETLEVDDWTMHHDATALAHNLARDPAAFGAPGTAATTSASSSSWLGGSPDNVVDGSSYNVFAFPKESPNDGPMTVVENPADATASPFGWHDTNGMSGPEFTTTRGNNVHAYLDQDANNVADPGQDTDGGLSLTFDFDADLSEHAQDYRDAVTTNLFYANNVTHDVLYHYGFDEPSGNFQANNYGRGGTGGDYVRAEAADGGGTNNANFSTPAADGGTPRMQMYLWPGNQFGSQNVVTVGAESFGAGWARFGPPARNVPVTGQLVVAGNGCTAAQYAPPASGSWIAVVDGVTTGAGSCTNPTRTAVAQAAGASAVIIAATTGTTPPILTGSQAAGPVGIPAVSVTPDDGTALKALAGQTADVAKASSHPGIRDGDFENGIIIHEYGHGVSLRLTGGPGVNCLTGNEQMGEGWSDYLAIGMLIDPALDDPEGARGMGPYALFQGDRSGNGIRPRPYSRTMDIQPFTYDRIKTDGWLNETTLSIPHGVGHGWAAVLWDMTWDLIDKHGFEPDLYSGWDGGGNTRALQYVMDGFKFQGCGPGFVAGRNAILAAAENLGGEDTCTVWTSFARRGLGFSAVQGTTNRNDNTEAFDIPADCKASGAGIVGTGKLANPPTVNTVDAGAAVPVQFSLGGNRGLDVLKDAQSPAYQQIDCTTLKPPQFATTQPASTTGNAPLTYNARQARYQYNWLTDESWAGTCQELQIILDDGTQHRAWFRFVEGD